MSDYDVNDSMLEVYLFESTTLLDQLDEILLQSEHDKNVSVDNINEIFRIMHTIKGSSAMMSFNIIAEVSHKLEDLFFIVRDMGLDNEYFDTLFDLVLRGSDFLKIEVEKIQLGEELTNDTAGLVEEILKLIADMKGENNAGAPEIGAKNAKTPETTAPKPNAAAAPSHEIAPRAADAKAKSKDHAQQSGGESASQSAKSVAGAAKAAQAGPRYKLKNGEKIYYLHAYFNVDCQMENLRAYMLVTKLQAIGRIEKMQPEDLESNPEAADIIQQYGFLCVLISTATKDEIEKTVSAIPTIESVRFLDKDPIDDAFGNDGIPEPSTFNVNEEAETADKAEEPDVPSTTDSQKSLVTNTQNTTQTQKTNVPEHEPAATKPIIAAAHDNNEAGGHKHAKQNLINVDLNKLDVLMDLVGEIVITESMVSGSPDLSGIELESFHKSARQLRKLTDELQDTVMSVRMIPVAATFQKMRRIVRDMGKQLDKEVELTLVGETTEVDKTIIDAIGDPLMHLVRNAMDHAIEPKSERALTTKSPVGNITLSAQNVGGDIIISVCDDGKGLDAEIIMNKARERGLLIKSENEYSDKEIYNLLMLPGFSTKETVTEFSGRGVGMDVVKKNIEKIGGTVTIESTKGKGTTILFKIPLTLAIIASMEIEAGSNTYAIPISNIRESFKASASQLLSDPDGNEMIMIRGAAYPIIRLHRIFNINECITVIEDGILLLVDSGDRLACILADKLLGKHQVVVKPLPNYLAYYDVKSIGIAGCTILGDGSISLILDIQSILNQY